MPPAAPPISYDPAVLPLLTPRLRTLLDGFLDVLDGTAPEPLLRTEVSGFHDPDEDTDQIVVRQHGPWPPPEASDHLAAIGLAVEAWMGTLSSEDRALFLERIAFGMRRDDQPRAT